MPPLKAPDTSLLTSTILNSGVVSLQTALLTLIADSPDAASRLEELLLCSEGASGEKGKKSGGGKRKARWSVCGNCEREFDTLEEGGTRVCVYHPQKVSVNYDHHMWEDDDDDPAHNFDQNLEDFPEGFVYECCGGDGSTMGCKKGKHVEVGMVKKKKKVEDWGEEDEDGETEDGETEDEESE